MPAISKTDPCAAYLVAKSIHHLCHCVLIKPCSLTPQLIWTYETFDICNFLPDSRLFPEMAPAAVVTSIPQFTAHSNNKLSNETSYLRESFEWNNMESALDWLAEYLLKDMGAGRFDFRYAQRRSRGMHSMMWSINPLHVR